ncbi:MAG: tryptophan-rich sensory protein [Sphingomonas bacterium]|uniref:TspO/MBR family protein n=1 Tax=Sphingomonas bacterium TaxID=1895847 RepID=UPI002632A93C|nr:TspO/MBR family protein [Sphingomonas bacterium]MDB5696808.1 tryptophan-rich sensory protein [Sphingomonas bacterium]
MSELASRGQLRWSFARWAAVCVPLVLLIGFASGQSTQSGSDSPWYAALAKPALNPPDWAFPVAWTLIYICMGLAVATVLNARGARGRWPAVALFAVLAALLAGWQPLFFGAHRIWAALALIVAILAVGIIVTLLFGRVRRTAAWLMVPLLVWVGFAGVLNWRIGQMNPDAERLAPAGRTTQML